MPTRIVSNVITTTAAGTYEVVSYTVPAGKFTLKNVLVGAEPTTFSTTEADLGYAYLQINGVDYRGIEARGMQGDAVGIYGCSSKGGLGKDSLFTFGAGFTFPILIPDGIEFPAGIVIKVMAEAATTTSTRWFGAIIGIEEVPVSYIPTSLVGTSTSSSAVYYPFQGKSFYANGRFWVFYYDGSNMVYRTSTDGSTWTTATTVRAAASGSDFSIWFDGTYVHYAYASSSSIYYRRGTPNADGTITWSAEQTVSTTYNRTYFPMVAVDSNGYVWIGYRDYDSVNAVYYPYVIKSGNNDGTWGTTPTGFPYQLSTTSNSGWRVSVVPLTAGKMLAVYAYPYATVKVQAWDGSAWLAEVATTSAIYYGHQHSVVAQGNDAHLVFLKYPTYDVIYTKYSYASNSFSAEKWLASAVATSAPVICINPSTNDLYVFWAGYPTADHIYYRKYTASTDTWETAVDCIDESSDKLTYYDRLTCFYQAYGNYIGLVYMTGTVYNVKFAYLQLAAPPPITETITAKNFPMLYLSKPKNAQELVSTVEGATIIDIAKDFPKYLIKKDKAEELRSKFS